MDQITERYERLLAVFDEALRKDPSARQSYLAAQHIQNPACMTRMLAPGFPDVT